MIDSNPSNAGNWQLVCKECLQIFDPETTIGVVAAHWNSFHPEEKPDAPQLNLVWIGIGPEPEIPEIPPQ